MSRQKAVETLRLGCKRWSFPVCDPSYGVDEAELREVLEATFGGTLPERRAVARAARDLAASGQFADDTETVLSVERIVSELDDSPDDRPADRWNWWMGALDVAHGGYEQFQVRAWREGDEDA